MKAKEPPSTGLGRRLFLKGAGLLGLMLGLPALAWSFAGRRFPVRTVERDDFRFDPDTGLVKSGAGPDEPYRLVVDGLVETPVSLSYRDLRAMPQVEQVSDFHCVEGWSVHDVRWGGIRFEEILKKVKADPKAKYAVFHALGRTRSRPGGQSHYIESFPIKKLLRPEKECLLVLDMDGRPLPHEHGAPLRLISPYDLAYKSIKYVTRIELSRGSRKGWWTLANPIYPVVAPVPKHRLRKK